MCIKKVIWPRSVPWGTPALIWHQSDILSHTFTHCFLSYKYEASQFIRNSGTSCSFSFDRRIWWLTLLNAFLKSKNSTHITFPGFSTIVSQPRSRSANVMYVERPFGNWWESIRSITSSSNHSWGYHSRHLDRVIGLRSVSILIGVSLLVGGRCHQISKWWEYMLHRYLNSIWYTHLGWGFQHMISVASWEWNLDRCPSGCWFIWGNWQHLIQV